ncbi:MAG: histidine phosphatase family protein [Acetobacteraceae bacterium]|nr:histidine phosphatase family protein [Acetobacteraceae bacterium]
MTVELWLVRHAIVAENERLKLYGVRDVPLCPDSLVAQAQQYEALARALPLPARWLCTPLSRTRRTAERIFAAGYPAQPLHIEPGLLEQDLGDWAGLAHAALPPLLAAPAHPFWPLAADEEPPDGESFEAVLARVGPTVERIAADADGQAVVAVCHGGTIRAAVAFAMGVDARAALHLSVQNLSLTRIEREPGGWRVGCVNELLGF